MFRMTGSGTPGLLSLISAAFASINRSSAARVIVMNECQSSGVFSSARSSSIRSGNVFCGVGFNFIFCLFRFAPKVGIGLAPLHLAVPFSLALHDMRLEGIRQRPEPLLFSLRPTPRRVDSCNLVHGL